MAAAAAAASSSAAAASGGAGGAGGDEDLSAKTMRKRYEGLLVVRSKAVKGKGAWYWSHLEPILVQNPETGLPKAVKLRCGLCNAMFSASNPSRTASEHLKRGTCPNFSGAALASSSSPSRPFAAASSPPLPPKSASGRKRSSSQQQQQHQQQQQQQHQQLALVTAAAAAAAGGAVAATALDERVPLHLSGGREDLGALALLEDNVKRIKSPGLKPGSTSSGLSREQSEAALSLLADWLYESYGTLSLSCVEHPKFKAFLNQLGLPALGRRFVAGARLDARFDEVKRQSEARLADAHFFQLCADGFKRRSAESSSSSPALAAAGELVYITLNLPNGSSLFWRAVPVAAATPKAVEAVLDEALAAVCGGSPERCVGIVSDTHKPAAKALCDIESGRPWMVNVQCQAQAFASLLNDFAKRCTLFRSVASDCLKLVAFCSANAPARGLLQRFHRDAAWRMRSLADQVATGGGSSAALALAVSEEVAGSARALQAMVADASFKMVYGEDPAAREVAEVVGGAGFWKDVEAVQAVVRVVRGMIREMEVERPLVSGCLPLWEELRDKLMEQCARHGAESGGILRLLQERFARNYHPAWSAALVLDPLYLVKDSNNRYLPPYKVLSSEQEKDVDRLITRLVSREEAHIVLMELMKWRSEGLDPLYARAVQVKDTDPATGRVKCMSGQSRRLVWETCLTDFRLLGKVAARLIFLHATSGGLKKWSLKTAQVTNSAVAGGSRAALERAGKMMYIAAHARLERHDFMSDEEREAMLGLDDEDNATSGGGGGGGGVLTLRGNNGSASGGDGQRSDQGGGHDDSGYLGAAHL